VDFRIAHALDLFSAHHDGFEDVLGFYESASQFLFAAVLVALVLIPRTRRAAVAAGASAGLALLVAHFVSVAVDRPRPFVDHAASIHAFASHAADPSLPSDHATAAFAIAAAVALRHRRVGLGLLLLATVVAIGRVFLGLHYPTDVLAGAALGTAAALLIWRVEPRLPDGSGLRRRLASGRAGAAAA
jgi:undecaprenyl-diphosphatase